MVSILPAVAEEAKAGFYPAREAFDKLRTAFMAAKIRTYNGSAPMTEAEAADAFMGILRWAIGQAERHTPEGIRQKVRDNLLRNTLALLPEGQAEALGLTAPAPAASPASAEASSETDAEPSEFGTAVAERMARLHVDREARRRLDDAERPKLELPPSKSLNDLLAEPDIPTPYVIEHLAPAGGRVLLAAPQKAGKTSLTGNLLRALADGEPFLDRFKVCQRKSRIVLIDNELSENTLRKWLREHGIINTAAVAEVISLRGRVGLFNLLDEKCRAAWAKRLRDIGCDYLVFDCLRPVLDALGLDENRDAGRFLVPFDALLHEAGIPDGLVVDHMGHGPERARGDSRKQDWPDAIWQIVREEPDNPRSARYFRAHGRDVDVPEGRLDYDPLTRRLTYAGGTRASSKAEAALKTVLAVLTADAKDGGEGLSVRAIQSAGVEAGHPRDNVRAAIKLGIGRELIETATGKGSAILHRIANACDICGQPVVAGQGGAHFECGQRVRDGLE